MKNQSCHNQYASHTLNFYYVCTFPLAKIVSAEHEIRTEKCSDTCHHKMKFVLAFTKNDLTLVEINAITLNFGLDTCQIKVGIVQVNTKRDRKMSDVRLLFHVLLVLSVLYYFTYPPMYY